jgi:hypothetical protein
MCVIITGLTFLLIVLYNISKPNLRHIPAGKFWCLHIQYNTQHSLLKTFFKQWKSYIIHYKAAEKAR